MSLIAVESWESGSARELSNAIFVPSGDHTGHPLSAGPAVSLFAPVSRRLATQICQCPAASFRMKAIRPFPPGVVACDEARESAASDHSGDDESVAKARHVFSFLSGCQRRRDCPKPSERRSLHSAVGLPGCVWASGHSSSDCLGREEPQVGAVCIHDVDPFARTGQVPLVSRDCDPLVVW